jgi:hypothetical protein
LTVIGTTLALAAAAAGCGSGSGSGSGQAAQSASATQSATRACPGARREWRRAWSDIAALRSAAHAENQAAVTHTTTRFLDHLSAAKAISLKAKNRLIDHAAAAATAGGCDQCFQQLEANRPIPSIRYGDKFPC